MEDSERQHMRQALHDLVGKVGENNAHLMNMQRTLADHSIERKAIWMKLDDHAEELKNMEVRIEVADKVRAAKTGMISLLVSLGVAALNIFWKGHK